MANIFNSVKGLHPKRNKFSADTYRNDFTAPLGVNIPCYIQEVPAATRIRVNASALVRLQALIAPVMDNIDYYTHFWVVPYRLLENDRFTQFFTGEIPAEDYDALFATPYELAEAVLSEIGYSDNVEHDYELIFGNGSILDFIGYDRKLFPDVSLNPQTSEYELSGGNNQTKLNWRGLIVYYMLHLNWYMNENVPYFSDFAELVDDLVKNQSLQSLASLLLASITMYGDYRMCSFLPHGWDKDYFTSALPNTQYGDPVTLPLVGSAPVVMPDSVFMGAPKGTTPNHDAVIAHFASPVITRDGIMTGSQRPTTVDLASAFLSSDDGDIRLKGFEGHLYKDISQTQDPAVFADLSEATAITINELRFANALQVFKERQLRFGRRRLEFYKGFFDVTPEDLRLQVPKYLGGGRIPINIADVEQTSSTSGSKALGSLAGKATAVAGGFAGFTHFCSEESVILGISFAMPHQTYANFLSRFKMKTNNIYDYFNPSFEHLGEQAIKNIEVYAGSSHPDQDFGYTPRYTEYRFHMNEMHGAFKDSLSFWTLGRIFSSQPALNANFVYMQPHVFDRIFAVSNQPNMVVSMLFHVQTIKPVSKFGTPMLLA